MNANGTNTLFITVAAWQDWEQKTEIFRRSALKQGIEVELFDTAVPWQGYYEHKIVRMREHLRQVQRSRPLIQYVVFTDARDAVFIKPKHVILTQLREADDGKVLFAVDNKLRTWPMQRTWLARRIALKYGLDGIINSGCYAGRVERVLALLDECIRVHWQLASGHILRPSIESMLYDELRSEYLSSDQFHLHAVQALWSDLIAVDITRRVFACFRDGFPLIKTAPELGSNGTMPLGSAGILHSPWMLHREHQTAAAVSGWKHWAITEGII